MHQPCISGCGVFLLQKWGNLYLKKSVMIYLSKTGTPQMVYIPKGRETIGSLVLSLRNTINQSVPVMVNVVDLQSDLYVQFRIDLPADIETGEYEYSLTDEAGVISTGLLFIEDLSELQEYQISIKYEQYNK